MTIDILQQMNIDNIVGKRDIAQLDYFYFSNKSSYFAGKDN